MVLYLKGFVGLPPLCYTAGDLQDVLGGFVQGLLDVIQAGLHYLEYQTKLAYDLTLGASTFNDTDHVHVLIAKYHE